MCLTPTGIRGVPPLSPVPSFFLSIPRVLTNPPNGSVFLTRVDTQLCTLHEWSLTFLSAFNGQDVIIMNKEKLVLLVIF